jgi:NADPH-dependent glutamate synthase beta subunit-like oxidoreductase
VIAYRRGASDMPAFADEVEEAREEGIEIEEWVIPSEVRAEGGRVRGVVFLRARPGPPDASGRPRPVAVPGTELVLDVDLVVVAAGESLDAAGLPVEWVRAGELAPADGRVMALGDCAGGGGTVAHAIGAGRRAAAAAAARLGGGAPSVDLLAERGAAPAVAGFEHVRPSWFRPAPGVPRGREDAAERRGDDREVRRGLGPGAARDEAARCLSCGTCAGCDVCLHLCPERAVRRGAPGAYGMDAARCKGCGVCVQECPRGAVELVELGGA